ncbi:MAG TPA: folylpolyglutamate synthase/dihydrofolate synthase family protein [Gemmataceae bacterium]|nr:folylpolyglutamate synthase/dihydrofolate synthase family protein [Gemmataceae bacterium]
MILSTQQAFDFWFGRINYEQVVPQPDDLKLDRMRTLLDRLGNPQRKLRIVHVAGSKGKGSTSAMLAAVLQRAGFRTGLFTSPHLCRVEERIQVDGEPISTEELVVLLTEVWRAVGAPAGSGPQRAASACLAPTFFEVATAVGFMHFVRRRVDVAVLEVGLGGRFDSTNVCQPELAVITSISLDHVRQLGDRITSIAMEKAGIIKPGVPAISGATAPEARQVIERICRERKAPLQQLGVDFDYAYAAGRVEDQPNGPIFSIQPRVQVTARRYRSPFMTLQLVGRHQAANAAVAVACVERLRNKGWQISDEALAWGLANVRWPARLEIVHHRPMTVLDCAHNVASAEALVETLQTSFINSRRLLVFASSNDKDIAGIFRALAPHFAHVFLTRYGNHPRSVAPHDLAQLLKRSAELSYSLCETATDAWQAARASAAPEDLICITGSVFLAGELRPALVKP